MFGGDQCGKDYAPHMWLGDHFIHNSGKTIRIGEWWYRAGRLNDETIVAERWKGGRFPFEGQTEQEVVLPDKMPPELLEAMKPVSRAAQEAFQRQMENQFGQPK